MINIDDFFNLLEEVCNELPDEFFKDLHQGVILSENIKFSPYAKHGTDLVILGEYHRGYYGNQIIIYYGSFKHNFSYLNEEELKNKLREVVRHEFRHHMENRAGIYGKDSLEREDKEFIRQYLRNS